MLTKIKTTINLLWNLAKRGKWILIPIVVALIIMAIIIILGTSTGLGPLIYPLI